VYFFWRKNIGAKAARNMFVKLTLGRKNKAKKSLKFENFFAQAIKEKKLILIL
jgi:hypothetical protein